MTDNDAGTKRLIAVLTNAADQLQAETGILRSTIAHALFLGCGIPYEVFDSEPQSFHPQPTGSHSSSRIDCIGIIGAGTMSQGIARAALRAGIDTRILIRDARNGQNLRKAIASQLEDTATLPQIGSSPDVLDGAEIVVEAVAEDVTVKRIVVAALEDNLSSDTILATSTSSLGVHDIADALRLPERLVGLHFFNPADRNPLVELIQNGASEEDIAQILRLGAQLGKEVIRVADSPGFLVNRVLIPYLNEVFHLAAEGVSLRDIDRDVRRYGFPVGPARLAGIVGLDVVVAIQKTLFQRLGYPTLAPAPALEALVDQGVLGSKTGHMFPAAIDSGLPPVNLA